MIRIVSMITRSAHETIAFLRCKVETFDVPMQQLRRRFSILWKRGRIADAERCSQAFDFCQADHVGDQRVIAPVADIVGDVAGFCLVVDGGGSDGGLAVECDLKQRRLEG